jgi:hypothetical protein
MPNWKKIITSGSTAILSNVTASSYTGSFTGSFLGTGSYATQALSASYAPGSAAFPYTGSAEISGSLIVRGASLVQDGSLGVVSTGTTNATDAFKVQNATPEDLLIIRDDGEIVVNTTKYSLNGILTNNGGVITEVNGYNGPPVIIDQSPNPPITLDIQNGLIINVT